MCQKKEHIGRSKRKIWDSKSGKYFNAGFCCSKCNTSEIHPDIVLAHSNTLLKHTLRELLQQLWAQIVFYRSWLINSSSNCSDVLRMSQSQVVITVQSQQRLCRGFYIKNIESKTKIKSSPFLRSVYMERPLYDSGPLKTSDNECVWLWSLCFH